MTDDALPHERAETAGRSAPPAPRQSICVYCGSRLGAAAKYVELARMLGAEIASAGLRLVYGAGDLGLMGAAASAARSAGGEVLGVIPEDLFGREVAGRGDPGVIVTESMHQRKALMLANADAAIILPGGVGTLDEFVEAATWRHLGIHAKPLVLLDPDGYWSPLMEMFERMKEEGFLWSNFAPDDRADAATESVFSLCRSPEDAIARIRRDWAARTWQGAAL